MNKATFLPRAAAAIAATFCAACASGPNYQRPDAPLATNWQQYPEFHVAAPADTLKKDGWWQIFSDAKLDQLSQQALQNNQNLKTAAARLEQARAQASVVSANLFPQVGLQAGATRAKTSADRPLAAYGSVNQSTVQDSYQFGFAASYELDMFGRIQRSIESAKASAEQAASDYENARLVMLAELAADYFNLRELDAEISVVREGVASQQKAYDLIKARHDLGAASGLDLAQQQAVLDTNRTQLELLQTQRSQFEHAIATLVGTPAPDFALAQQEFNNVVPAIPIGIPADLLQRRPDIASAERAVQVANANIGVARAAYFPTLIMQTNGGWNSNTFSQLFNAPSILWSLGANVAQTVFDGGKTNANVRFAEAAYSATVSGYRQSVLVAMQEVQDGVSGLSVLERAAQQANASVASAQRVLNLANDRYSGGLDNYLTVITAQQTLLANQRLATQIHGRQLITSIALIKALGGGWQMGTGGQPVASSQAH